MGLFLKSRTGSYEGFCSPDSSMGGVLGGESWFKERRD